MNSIIIYMPMISKWIVLLISEPQEDLARIIACVSDIRTWMVHNKLKINDDKTEFLILHSAYINLTHNLEFKVGQGKIKPSNSCRNLWVVFDSHLKLENQVQSICRSVNFYLRSIRSVRNSLTDEATTQLVHSLIISRLDYCNSLLYGLSIHRSYVSSAFRTLLPGLLHAVLKLNTSPCALQSSLVANENENFVKAIAGGTLYMSVCRNLHRHTCVSLSIQNIKQNMGSMMICWIYSTSHDQRM